MRQHLIWEEPVTGVSPIDQDLSDGVVAYLGYGEAASWRRRPEAVPAGLLDPVELVVAEADSITVDWDGKCLPGAGVEMHDRMAALHPELSPDALAALRWKWTFDWR